MNLKQIQEAPPRELIYASPDKGKRKGKVHLILTRPIGNLTHGITACGLHALPQWIGIGQDKVNCRVCARDIREHKIRQSLANQFVTEEVLRNRIDCLKLVLHGIAGLSPDKSKYPDGETPFEEAVRLALTGIHNLETGFYDDLPIILTDEAVKKIRIQSKSLQMYEMLESIYQWGDDLMGIKKEIIDYVERRVKPDRYKNKNRKTIRKE